MANIERSINPVENTPLVNQLVVFSVPSCVAENLKNSRTPFIENIIDAFQRGCQATIDKSTAEQEIPNTETLNHSFRYLAVAIPCEVYKAVVTLARERFDGDIKAATSSLIIKGVELGLDTTTSAEPVYQHSQVNSYTKQPFRRQTLKPALHLPKTVTRGAPRVPLKKNEIDSEKSKLKGLIIPTADDLKRRRLSLGLSQRKMAVEANKSRSWLCEMERGKRNNIDSFIYYDAILTNLENKARD